MRTPLLFCVLALAACGTSSAAPSAPPATAASAVPTTLPFIEDDYARAIATAREQHKPLFVDAWAPWCHTCLSMRAYTFRDAKVRAVAGEFTWASIDTENPKNAAWVEQHPMKAWPTLWVVDPQSGATVLEWANSATADELVPLLEEARRAMREGGAMRDVSPAQALESRVEALATKKDWAGCVALADAEIPKVGRGIGRALTIELGCLAQTPPSEARRAPLDRAIALGRKVTSDPSEPLLADDRSDLYGSMVEALESDARDAEAKQTARAWSAYLDGEASRAPDPEARAVFDAHRVEAYLAVGEPERAVPMLEASARDFPKDYNPPARLARVYFVMKRYDDALAAIDRAIALAYGPRTLRLLILKADVEHAKGDGAGELKTIDDAVARANAMPPSPRYAPLKAQLERRAAALRAGDPGAK